MTFKIGDRFPSFKDFKQILEQYKADTNTDFSISDSKSLVSCQKRCPKMVAKASPELKYYYIKYRCILGGEFKKSNSRGLRSIGTIRKGCPVHISLTLAPNSDALAITALCLDHNHDTSEALYIDVPCGRKRNLASFKVPLTPSMDRDRHRRKRRKEAFAQGTDNVERLLDLIGTEVPNVEPINEQMVETEIITNPNENVSYSIPEEQEPMQSGEPVCKCSIGTFDLTKQDLMKMEVEEHYHRLEVLQLQKTYESERIEKMRYLYDLKIRLAEQELQNINF